MTNDGPIWLGVLIALAAAFLSAATLWNGASRAQIAALRDEVADLRAHCDRCDAQVSQLRDENQWLMRQLRLSDRHRRIEKDGC